MRSELRQSFCCRCSNSASSKALFPEIPLPLNVSRIFSIGVIHRTWSSTQMSFERPAFQRLSSLRGKNLLPSKPLRAFFAKLDKIVPFTFNNNSLLGESEIKHVFFISDWKRKWEAVWVVAEAPKCSILPPTKFELSSKTKSTKNCHRVTCMGIISEVRC